MQRFAGFTKALAVWLLPLLLVVVGIYEGDAQPQSPAVIWYAPFLSGGGYCSEAHSYVTSISAALRTIGDAEVAAALEDAAATAEEDDGAVDARAGSSSLSSDPVTQQEEEEGETAEGSPPFALYVTQHGDSFNAAFIRDIPDDMRELLEEHWIEPRDFYWRLHDQKIAIAICHSEPGAWHPAHYSTSRCPPEGAQFTIGRTMFETDRVPKGWPDRMNAMDEIWVPTRFQEQVFVDGGVRPGAIQVVPEAVDVQFFDPERVATNYDLASQISGVTETTTVFLSIFKWEERKAWRVLLKAYFEAFTKSADVALVLLTNAYHAESESASDFMDVIENFTLEALGKPLSELPRVHVLPPQVPQAELPSLYKAATAFVLPSRGEGWGRPHVEAMAMEIPVIATFWSGTTEYMTQENSYPLRIDGLVEITVGAFRGHKWADPSVAHLKELLVHVKDHPEEAIAKGKKARQDMVAKYAPDIIGKLILGHIERILSREAQREESAETATSNNTDDHDEL
ncbi:hypothetical protein Gpo141_00003085 [Globisporangium polare]